jgi:hypothetical protein
MRIMQLFEASYDGMIVNLRTQYPEQVAYINDNLRWAKTVLKKDERIVWWLRLLTQHLKDPNSIDIQNIGSEIEHYMGFAIPGIQEYQFAKKTPEQIVAELNAIQQEHEKKLSQDKPTVTPQEGDHELIKFNDGSAWWFVNRAYCSDEGASGSHCGNVTGQRKKDQRILSYRIDNRVKMTFILEPNGKLGEMKAWGNQKPSKRLHPYIMSLLQNDIIKGIKGGGYLPDNNFSIFDLDDKDLRTLQQVKPNLIRDQISISPIQIIKAPVWLRKIYMKNIQKISGISNIIDTEGNYRNDIKSWSQAVNENTNLSLIVPDEFVSQFKELIIRELHSDPKSMLTVASNYIRNDFEICKNFIENDRYNRNISYILPNNKNYATLCKIAVIKDTNALEHIPEEHRTPDLCKMAVEQTGLALYYVPKEYRTPELCKIALEQDEPPSLNDVPKEHRTPDLCKIAVTNNGFELEYVPKKLRTPELFKIAVSNQSRLLSAVPETLRTPELCKIAVTGDGWTLSKVPEKLRTPELCMIAVKTYGIALEYVPEKFRTLELCKLAVTDDSRALEYVPEELRTAVMRDIDT